MTIFALEVFGIDFTFVRSIVLNCVLACSVKAPIHELDEIVAAFYSFEGVDSSTCRSGLVVVDTASMAKSGLGSSEIDIVSNELALLNQVVDIVIDLDPDIVVGWEIQAASWGYLNARGRQYGPLFSCSNQFSFIICQGLILRT
jgi:DNA polymerase elongation subunit (family B)